MKNPANTRSTHHPVILLAFSILLALACNSFTVFSTATPGLLHFENEFVSFDYLPGMDLHPSPVGSFQSIPDYQLGGEFVVGLGDLQFSNSDRYFRSIRISRQPMPSGSNLETIMQEAYLQADPYDLWGPGVMVSAVPVTVAGLPALQTTYRRYIGEPAYELRDVWIPKEDALFIVAIWTQYTNPEALAAFQAHANLLLNSLQIK
jgi:hypothetical protein